MKKLLIVISILSTLNVFSYDSMLVKTLSSERVKALISHESTQKSSLFGVVDEYARRGTRPRCICESYTFYFRTFHYEDGKRKPATKAFSVNAMGFGDNFTVNISEKRKP